MKHHTLKAWKFFVAVSGQIVLLAAAWGFLCVIYLNNPLILNDSIAFLVSSHPSETTLVITLTATVLSVAGTMFLSIAFEEALRHRMQESISLIELNTGIALARGSYIINFRHPILASVTLAIFVVTKLLVSGWTALLTPTLLNWSIHASGWEVDLTSSWFESMLQQELVQSGAALVRGNSTEIFDLDSVLSGIAAAQYSFNTPGIFNFNGAKYNVSTGGILPAVPGYGNTDNPVSVNNTGLAFAGGQVPTHLQVDFPYGRVKQGIGRGFTLLQQGLTANVTCRQINATSDNLNFSSSFVPLPVPFANGTAAYWLWAWNVTSNCGEGLPSQQQYVTRSNSSTVPLTSTSGFLSFLVCPYPIGQTGVSWEQFTVISNASWRYDFLPLTACTINPLVTTSLVNYTDAAINTTVISSWSLGNSSLVLPQFLAALVAHQSDITQSLTTNAIGDALYAIYISASENNSTKPEDVINLLLKELEQYWRGVIEFSGTFLRSAFSVYPDAAIPIEARISLNGSETIVTMGWQRRSDIWGYTITPITIVALMMCTAVGYTLWHVYIERGHDPFTMFDPWNPIHVMMASSKKDSNDDKGNLDEYLAGFERGGVGRNENLRVQLTNVGPYRKGFRVTND